MRNFQSLAPIAEEERILTHEDRVRASKKYGLHPPGEDSDEEEGVSRGSRSMKAYKSSRFRNLET